MYLYRDTLSFLIVTALCVSRGDAGAEQANELIGAAASAIVQPNASETHGQPKGRTDQSSNATIQAGTCPPTGSTKPSGAGKATPRRDDHSAINQIINCTPQNVSIPLQGVCLPGPVVTLLCPTPAVSAPVAKCDAADVLSALAWPLVGIAALGTVIWSRNLRRMMIRLQRHVTKAKVGPVEVEFGAEAAKDVKASIGLDLKDFEAAAMSEYDRQARRKQLAQRLHAAVEEVRKMEHFEKADHVRATVHVEDVIFAGHLYQLLDYQPDKTGRGRRWSERYGILGRAWRLQKSIFSNSALGTGDSKQTLIESWGMNLAEAEQASRTEARQSFLCILLRVQTRQVGVLFLDAKRKDVFKDVASSPSGTGSFHVKPALEQLSAVAALAQGVDEAMEELRKGGTYLSFETKEQRA